MVFSSHIFIYYFLPLALGLYYATPVKLRNLTLTIVSYVFYCWTVPKALILIAWTTLVDYACGNFIDGHWRFSTRRASSGNADARASVRQRKLFLVVSLTSNLVMLAVFKYGKFIGDNVNVVLHVFGHRTIHVPALTLPPGISFYVFESLSYNLDIYFARARPAVLAIPPPEREGTLGLVKRELRGLSAFACYITQFPHLVAGPIIRYQDLEPQLHDRRHSLEKFSRGVFFFAFGLAKKNLLANPMGEIADAAFSTSGLGLGSAWFGVFAYAFQIYFDFSGYSDMAIGLALMLGFRFPINFDSPYKAASITEFWRRWHISLSTWLRNYLYIPLGGNRCGSVKTYRNLLVVMLLGGLWHGASWNFAIWGGIHGFWLAFERILGKRSVYAGLPRFARVGATFLIVNLAWVFFRAHDFSGAVSYLGSLFGMGEVTPSATLISSVLYSPDHLLTFTLAAAIAFFAPTTNELSNRITLPRVSYALAMLVWSLVAMSAQSYSPFLYFQF